MKLAAGIALFLLCGLAGEGKARRLSHREQKLARFCDLIREIGDRQLNELVSFAEAAMRCPASSEKEQLLSLLHGEMQRMPLLTKEERDSIAAYARSQSRSVLALRKELDALLTLLQRDRELAREESARKGQVYRSVGYLSGAAMLLLVL